ncbi:hypothetical protein EDB19DRAFT_1738222 [Suillus lakei]|nr:hypothetical protein EDB19DRAFT_1738222 [Suillus lakei]
MRKWPELQVPSKPLLAFSTLTIILRITVLDLIFYLSGCKLRHYFSTRVHETRSIVKPTGTGCTSLDERDGSTI